MDELIEDLLQGKHKPKTNLANRYWQNNVKEFKNELHHHLSRLFEYAPLISCILLAVASINSFKIGETAYFYMAPSILIALFPSYLSKIVLLKGFTQKNIRIYFEIFCFSILFSTIYSYKTMLDSGEMPHESMIWMISGFMVLFPFYETKTKYLIRHLVVILITISVFFLVLGEGYRSNLLGSINGFLIGIAISIWIFSLKTTIFFSSSFNRKVLTNLIGGMRNGFYHHQLLQALPTGQEKTRAQKHQSMTWAQRLKRVFNIDIETCEQCGGAVKVIASIEDPLVIQKILSHLNTKNDEVVELLPPQSRAPPQISLFE